jgi:hypothetical protein
MMVLMGGGNPQELNTLGKVAVGAGSGGNVNM